MTVDDNRQYAELPGQSDARNLCGRHAEGLAADPQHRRHEYAGDAAL